MKINTQNIEIRLCTSFEVKEIYEIQNIVAEVTFGNKYSLRNLQGLGYEIKTWYQKDKNIRRHILLKKLEKN